MKYQDLRRLAIAFACAVALHEIAVAFIPLQRPIEDQEESVAHVTIARIVRRPTPAPTPTPAPVHLSAVSQTTAGLRARVEPVKHAGAKRPTPPKVVYATPDASIPTGGQAAGAQNGQDAGSLSSVNGNGNGTGDSGNGNANSSIPCGAVDFQAVGNAHYNPDTGFYERSNIVAYVHYSDGSLERVPLDWTWRYKSEADDPFNPGSDALMYFEFPPIAQRAIEPAIVQYIIQHTSASGATRLNERCPNIGPLVAPSASPQPQL
ncbi:MAG TPA: hypothetical protein VMG98_12990 [Verrucomicrobiae bacterium]|nr:hypothetical protein [Verrucomicrobiae bacterium]